MHNLNKITKILGASLVLAASNAAMAEDVNVPVNAVIDNTIDFTVLGTLDFGTLRATPSTVVNECAVLVLPADSADPISSALVAVSEANDLCAGGLVNAVVQNVGGVIVRPEFTVTGLAQFTTLNLFVPARGAGDDIYLSQGGDPAAASVLEVVDFTIQQTNATPGPIAITKATGAGLITADATGDITFTLGATLVTDGRASSLDYVNQPYTGAFDVEVTY